jgi:hypothetical protein
MPHRNPAARRRLSRLVVFSLLAWTLVALGRAPRAAHGADVEAEPRIELAPPPAPVRRAKRRAPRRLAASFSLAVLFFAGASFSAVAGDRAVSLLGEEGDAAEVAVSDAAAVPEAEVPVADPAAVPVEAPTPEPAPTEPTPAPAEPAPEPQPEEVAPATQGSEPAVDPSVPHVAEALPADEPVAEEPELQPERQGTATLAPTAEAAPAHARTPARRPAARAPKTSPAVAAQPVAVPAPTNEHEHERAPLDPETTEPGVDATVWLHRALPDPTPPSLRLSREYASRLVGMSRAAGADWALVLGVLRAETGRVQAPVRPVTIAETASRLVDLGSRRNAWGAALALTGRTATSDRAVALARYYRAIGIGGLVHGLVAEEERLARELLADERVTIYPGGREDLAAGRVDVRIVALIAYLAEAYDQVTVSSLISGHRLYARPGVVSAHAYGAAVDIAALDGTPILGHQEPGSVTETAVRDILLLPAEMLPRQVISLIGMGGPSFALANHYDHVHVGF